ncbi:putative thermospermine synthase [Helianthus anomalus]
MGDIHCSNGNGNGNGNVNVNGNGDGNTNAYLQRKSCWYEEEIEEDLRWCFALNSILHTGATQFQDIQLLDTKPFGKITNSMEIGESTCLIVIEICSLELV